MTFQLPPARLQLLDDKTSGSLVRTTSTMGHAEPHMAILPLDFLI